MTVLMTAESVGGVWTYALDLSRGLAARGVTVVLAVMGGPLSVEQRRAAGDVPGLVLQSRPYKLEWMNHSEAEVEKAGAWLLDLARATAPDLVHINGFVHGSLPFTAPVLVAAHSCVLSWFRAVKRAAPSSDWLRYEQRVKRGLAAARMIVAPSRAMALSVIHHYSPDTPVIAVHSGRHAEGFSPGAKEPFVLTAGRVWDEAKNVRQLAAVAPRLLWPIYVAGDGSHGLPGLKPLGRLSSATLAQWFGRASIYALPARYEPFGLSAVEAALSGCALVLGDIASLRELWDGAATFVDPDDADALAAALGRLMEQRSHRLRMAKLARERAARYTVDAMADAYFAVYRRLSSTPPRSMPRRFACAS